NALAAWSSRWRFGLRNRIEGEQIIEERRVFLQVDELDGILFRFRRHRNRQDHRQIFRRGNGHRVDEELAILLARARENVRISDALHFARKTAHDRTPFGIDIWARRGRVIVSTLPFKPRKFYTITS